MWKWEAEGQPKAVVAIVHSAYEHNSRYAWFIQSLRNSNFHVVMGDLPGHGSKSSGKTHDESFESYVQYVKDLINIGIDDGLPLFIVGHGLGATLVMRFLQMEKIECAGVILSSPWLHLQNQPPKYSSMLTKITSSMKVEHEINIEQLTRNYDLYIEAREDVLYNPVVTAGWYKELLNMMKTVGQSEKSIQNVPILLHVASEDKITSISYAREWLVKQNLSEFHFKEWNRLYHDIYQEPEREEVFSYTESFMHTVLKSLGYII